MMETKVNPKVILRIHRIHEECGWDDEATLEKFYRILKSMGMGGPVIKGYFRLLMYVGMPTPFLSSDPEFMRRRAEADGYVDWLLSRREAGDE